MFVVEVFFNPRFVRVTGEQHKVGRTILKISLAYNYTPLPTLELYAYDKFMEKLLFLLFMLYFLPKAMAQECIGSETAKHFVVYLHGIDTQEPSPQEKTNREKLNSLAKKLNLRIAIPRATKKCPNEPAMLCWGWNFNDAEVTKLTLEEVAAKAKKCFPKAEKQILLGFSNGGFVVNRIVQDCLKTPYSKLVSIAAGGSWKTGTAQDLSRCGSIVFLIGQKDEFNYVSVKKYETWLKQNKATTKLVEFSGSHELPSNELEQVLRNIIK